MTTIERSEIDTCALTGFTFDQLSAKAQTSARHQGTLPRYACSILGQTLNQELGVMVRGIRFRPNGDGGETISLTAVVDVEAFANEKSVFGQLAIRHAQRAVRRLPRAIRRTLTFTIDERLTSSNRWQPFVYFDKIDVDQQSLSDRERVIYREIDTLIHDATRQIEAMLPPLFDWMVREGHRIIERTIHASDLQFDKFGNLL